jgi:hypothetical protein
MSLAESARELSALTGHYRTTDPNKAQALEEAGLFEPGTAYVDPASLPRGTAQNYKAGLGKKTLSPEEVRQASAELSALTRGPYFSNEKLNEILSDPEKTRRAREAGLIE